jgi:hypothetical protein
MAVFTALTASLVAAGFSTFLAGLTVAALQVALGVGINLIAQSMSGQPQEARFAVQGQVQSGDDLQRSINFGYNCTAGSKVYQNEWGDGGVYSTRVIAIGDAPIRELIGVEVDGSPVTLEATPHASMGYPVSEFRKDGKDHLWIKFYDGTQTAADTFLVGTVASDERPYGANRIGKGVPYVIATSLTPERTDGEDQPLFQGFPAYKFITNGVKLYDISKDSSAGGSGPQRWASTIPTSLEIANWGGDGDFLPPVQIYNLLRGIRVSGQWLYGLQDVSAARLPAANWIAQINKARAAVEGEHGDEPTYRSGGEIQVGAPIHLAIEALLTSCQGRLTEVGGAYKIYLGEPDSPVWQFSDDDILSSEEQSFTPFYGLADTVNGISATYPNPAEGWNQKTAPPLLRPDLEAKDGNRRLMSSVSLDMVPYGAQVQRLMKSGLLEALRARRHTFVLGPEARVLEPGDVIQWTSVRNGYVDKLFRVDGVVYKANLDVIIDITEVDPSDYDWDPETDFTPVVDGAIGTMAPVPAPLTGWQVFPDTIDDGAGTPRRPSIRVEYASGLSNVQRVRVQVRLDGTTDIVFDGEHPYGTPWKNVLQGSFLPATNYEVRGILVGPKRSTWSAWLDVTTDDVRLGAADLWPISEEQLTAALQSDQAWIRGETRNVKATVDAIVKRTVDQDFANFADKQQLRTELSTRAQDIESSYTLLVTTAVGVVDGKLTGVSQRVETLEVGIQGLASVTAVNAIDLRLSTAEGTISTQGTAISGLSSALAGKADVSVTDALDLKITENASGLQTQAGWLRDARSTVYVNAMGQVEQDFANFRDKSDVLAATANVYQFADTQVRALNGTLELQASLIQQAQTSIGAKADATALIALDTRVGSTPVGYSTLADAVLGVSSTVDGVTGGSRVRFSAAYTPAAGWTVRAGMEVRVGTSDTYKSGGIYFEATTSNSRAFLDADYVAVMNGGVPAALFQAGTTYLSNARIRDLDATNITAAKIDAALILQNGTAITDLIANNAVSVGDAVTTAGSINVVRASSPEVTIQTLTMTPNNGYTKVRCSAFLIPVTNGNIYHKYRLYKNGTEVASRFLYVTGGSPGTPIIDYQDSSPGTASITWTFTAQNLQSDQSPQPSIITGTDVIHSRTIDTFNGKK